MAGQGLCPLLPHRLLSHHRWPGRQISEPVNVLHVLPGDEVAIDGTIPENIKSTNTLTYTSDSPDLAVNFIVIHPGYFLGGNMWRGRLTVGSNLAPGKYTVTVKPKADPAAKPGYQFRVVVYPDAASQRQAFQSAIKRQTGFSPYLVAAACVPLILISLAAVYLMSQRIDSLQAQEGRAEVYRVTWKEGQYEAHLWPGDRTWRQPRGLGHALRSGG